MKVIGAMGLHLTLAKPGEDLKAKLKAKAAAKPVAAKKAATVGKRGLSTATKACRKEANESEPSKKCR